MNALTFDSYGAQCQLGRRSRQRASRHYFDWTARDILQRAFIHVIISIRKKFTTTIDETGTRCVCMFLLWLAEVVRAWKGGWLIKRVWPKGDVAKRRCGGVPCGRLLWLTFRTGPSVRWLWHFRWIQTATRSTRSQDALHIWGGQTHTHSLSTSVPGKTVCQIQSTVERRVTRDSCEMTIA